MNKSRTKCEQVVKTSHEEEAEGKNYYSGCRVGCRLYGVWWFPTVVRIRLSQPPAGDWLAGAWAELGN